MGEAPDKNIEILLKKLLDDISNQAEERQLNHILADLTNESLIKETLIRELSGFDENWDEEDSADYERVLENILHEISRKVDHEYLQYSSIRKTKLRRMVYYGTGIAALLAVVFFLGTLFSGSGKNVQVGSSVKIAYNEIKVPLGSRSEIFLSDSTCIILNSGSSIRYRTDFNVNNRDLILKGEAYFKVAKNVNLPLNVNAGNITIKAVGTEFNVKAYDEEGTIETTLVEGKVEITNSSLKGADKQYLGLLPDQKAIYIKEASSFSLEKIEALDSSEVKPSKTILKDFLISPGVEVDKVVAWTRGKLILRGEKLDYMCTELQRKYDVRFIFNDEEIKKFRFTGTLLDESLEQVLSMVKLTAPIDFDIEGKTVFLSIDRDKIGDYSKYIK